jgi:hypothetical protein
VESETVPLPMRMEDVRELPEVIRVEPETVRNERLPNR